MELIQPKSSGKDKLTREWLHTNASASPISLAQTLEHDGIAKALHGQCLDIFRRIYRLKQQACPSDKSIPKIKEALGKLYLWGNAFEGGQLDRALESSNDVRIEVLDSLSAIATLLLREWRSQAQIKHDVSRQGIMHELEDLTAQAKNITSTQRDLGGKKSSYESDSDTNEYSSDEDDCENSDHGEHDDFVGEIELHLKWLSELSPTLEQNLVNKQKTQVAKVAPCNSRFLVSTPAQYYASLVRERYKLADERLVERLGEANWQRHLNVRKSSPIVDNTDEENGPAASSIFKPFSAFYDSEIGTSVNYVAEDARSHTSFLSTNSESEVGVARVPATPAEVQAGTPFECFVCKRTLSKIKNRVDWKMHVFSDLRPYICTFPHCQDELVQFDHRSDWANHEFKKHRVRKAWNCLACSERLTAVDEWKQHLQKVHDIRLTGQNLQAVCSMASIEEERPAEQEECPLCRKVINKSRRGFTAHVGRHMEQIALIVLPPDMDENESDSCISSVEDISGDKSQEPLNIALEGILGEKKRKAYRAEEEITPSTDSDQVSTVSKQGSASRHFDRGVQLLCGANQSGIEDPIQKSDPRPLETTSDRHDRCECLNCWVMKLKGARSDLAPPVPCFADCGEAFKNHLEGERHLRTHFGGDGKWRCPHLYCPRPDKAFPRWGSFYRHIQTIHCTERSNFFCPVLDCSYHKKGFTRKDNLNEHVRKVHHNVTKIAPAGTIRRIQPKPVNEGTNNQV